MYLLSSSNSAQIYVIKVFHFRLQRIPNKVLVRMLRGVRTCSHCITSSPQIQCLTQQQK